MKNFFVVLLALISLTAFSQDGNDPFAGAIPLSYQGRPATDLIYKGKLLTPKEAHKLYEMYKNKKGQPTLHLHELNPTEETDIWKNKFPRSEDLEDANLDDLPFQELFDDASYLSDGVVKSGMYKFNVMKVDKNGTPGIYSILLGTSLHNILLRKALLRKIGYSVGPTKHLKKIDINFRSIEQLKEFKRSISLKALASPDRWIIKEDEQALRVTLQDVVVIESIEKQFNFALGDITEGLIEGRRLINSLLIPFNLVDIPESVNLFRPRAGRIVTEHALFPYDQRSEFYTTKDDAIWIIKRILKLTESDWEYIVDEGKLPPEVAALTLEKLKARRNSLAEVFDLNVKDLKVNGKVSSGTRLVKGRLIQEEWDGYASRFAHGTPESPLSRSNVTAMIKSKAIGLAIDTAMSMVNSMPFLATNVKKLNESNKNAFEQSMQDALQQSILNGTTHKASVGSWTFPTFSGSLNLSRNIVTGAYLGTDALVQLVDNIGFNVSAGLFTGFAGLPEIKGIGKVKQELGLGVSANLIFNRNYSHLKPVTTIHKALKEPFKNMITIVRKKKVGNLLNDIIENKDDDPEKIAEALKVFKENLEIGESFLITDKLIAGANASAKVALFKWLSMGLSVTPSNLTVFRLHIHRKSEDTIQVYRDFGDLAGVNIALGLNSFVPVVKANIRFSKGIAKTKFYTVNMSQSNPNLADDLLALREVMVSSNTELLDFLHPPFTVKNKFNERQMGLGIFTFRMNKIKSNANYVIATPEGQEKQLYRVYSGFSKGMNYQDYVSDLISQWVGKILNGGFTMTGLGGGNPGYSLYGTGENRTAVLESFVTEKGKLDEPLVKVSRIYNGWQAKQKKAEKLLKKIQNRYRFPFYSEHTFDGISKLFLYNVNVNFVFFKEAFHHILSLDRKEIKRIFVEHSNKNEPGEKENGKIIFSLGYKRFLKHIRKYKGEKRFNTIRNAEKIDEKYCRKLDKLKKKFSGDEKAEIETIIDSGKCSKEQYKEYKYLARISSKYEKNCKRIEKLLTDNADKYDKEDKAEIQAVLAEGKCTYKQYRNYKKLNIAKTRKKIANHIIRLFELAESKLTIQGILELVGGKENLYVYSAIEGFKQGLEKDVDDQTFHSHTIGELGNKDAEGPSAFILRRTGMSPAEFYSYWLMGRVI